MFKHIWKSLDPQSRFVGVGGPADPANLYGHLNRVHDGVGHVHVDQSRPGHSDVHLNVAVPLDRFTAGANGGPVMVEALGEHLRRSHAGFSVDPRNGEVPAVARFPSQERDDR